MEQAEIERNNEKAIAGAITVGLAERVSAKLNKLIENGHDTTVLMIGLMLAVFKDGPMDWGLDFFLIGEIPILGQLPGMFVTATLMYFMHGKGMLKRKVLLKVGVWLLADNFPFLINNLPLTTIGVLLSWKYVRDEALQAETNLRDLHQKTEEELEAIEKAE